MEMRRVFFVSLFARRRIFLRKCVFRLPRPAMRCDVCLALLPRKVGQKSPAARRERTRILDARDVQRGGDFFP